MMGFPMLTVNGETPGEDVKVAPGMLLWTVQHESKYQLLNGADISGLSTLVKNHIVRFAQVSRIPLNYFQVTGQIASDDTQKADETGLVSKAGKRAKSYGTVWSEVMKTARTLSNIYGRTRYDDTRIMVEWGPFTRIDESADEAADTMTRKTKADTYDRLLMLAPGADRYKLAKVAGYNDEEAAIVSATLEDGEITQ